jgi:hypothetical protein
MLVDRGKGKEVEEASEGALQVPESLSVEFRNVWRGFSDRKPHESTV